MVTPNHISGDTSRRRTRIKLCGMRRMEDISYCNECNPDYVGYIFAPTKRFVTDELASSMTKALNPSIIPVGVFVNEPIEHVISLVKNGIIKMVQLHGDEDEQYVSALKQHIDVPLIKAVRVRSRQQILDYQNFPTDYILLDAYKPDEYGGSGTQFDHSLIPENYPEFFLAGGMDASNLTDAISKYDPFCIDLSSAIETDGFKDLTKMKEIMKILEDYNDRK